MASRLGIVAGGGDLPARFIKTCRSIGRTPFVLALEGQAARDAFPDAPDAWVGLGEIGRGLEILRRAEVGELVFVGRIRRPALTQLRPDMWTARFIAGAGRTLLGDDSAMSTVLRAIEAEGFRVVAPESVVASLLAREGPYGALVPDDDARADIVRGIEVARALGCLDVGQGAIVQNGRVIAVEAAEGTDAMIARSAELHLTGPGGVLVKVAKPGQERRVDLPTVGVATVAAAAAAGLRGIAVEAGSALVVDGAEVGQAADRAGIFVFGLPVAG
jgi:DUF1009 family protein